MRSLRQIIGDFAYKLSRKIGKKICDKEKSHDWLELAPEDRSLASEADVRWVCLRCGITTNEENPRGRKSYN